MHDLRSSVNLSIKQLAVCSFDLLLIILRRKKKSVFSSLLALAHSDQSRPLDTSQTFKGKKGDKITKKSLIFPCIHTLEKGHAKTELYFVVHIYAVLLYRKDSITLNLMNLNFSLTAFNDFQNPIIFF